MTTPLDDLPDDADEYSPLRELLNDPDRSANMRIPDDAIAHRYPGDGHQDHDAETLDGVVTDPTLFDPEGGP